MGGGELMHKKTASNQCTPTSRMRQQSINVPLLSTKGQNMEGERARRDKVEENQSEREQKRKMLPFTTTAMLESVARLIGMAGLLLVRDGLTAGCCGNSTVLRSLLLGPHIPLSHTKPQKAKEQESVSIKKSAEDSRSKLVFEEVDL